MDRFTSGVLNGLRTCKWQTFGGTPGVLAVGDGATPGGHPDNVLSLGLLSAASVALSEVTGEDHDKVPGHVQGGLGV